MDLEMCNSSGRFWLELDSLWWLVWALMNALIAITRIIERYETDYALKSCMISFLSSDDMLFNGKSFAQKDLQLISLVSSVSEKERQSLTQIVKKIDQAKICSFSQGNLSLLWLSKSSLTWKIVKGLWARLSWLIRAFRSLSFVWIRFTKWISFSHFSLWL